MPDAALLVGIGVCCVLALPLLRWRSARSRWRRLLGPGIARGPIGRWIVAPLRWHEPRDGNPNARGEIRGRVRRARLLVLVVVAFASLGLLSGGPVAAGLLAVYGGTGAKLASLRRRRRAEAASLRGAADTVAGLAAELRAGLPVGPALAETRPALRPPLVRGSAAASVSRRVDAAIAVAESSGAPLADVLDRLDEHLRALSRSRAVAEAQAAGARASALMLAGLPVAGIGLGYAVGVDPFAVLLHTPLGAACLTGAVLLQLTGLAWSMRLSRFEVSV